MNAPFIPPRRSAVAVYHFNMPVGGFFKERCDMGRDSQNRDRRQQSIIASAAKWAQRNNPSARFTTRLLDGDDAGFVGCWRTA